MDYRMKRMICSEKGVTLIELLVSSMITLVLAGVVMIIYSMYQAQFRENSAFLTMQMRYENISEQIAFHTRKAHKVLDATVAYNDSCQKIADIVTSVQFYNSSGKVYAGIGLSHDTLIEYDTLSKKWVSFNAGNGTVLVKSGSNFVLNGCRDEITLNLALKFPIRDTVYYLSPRMDQFVCRNRN